MVHGPLRGVVRGGPTTMAGHRAQWSSTEWPLRGAVALPLEGKMEGAMWRSWGIAHWGWDNGEEAAHRRWDSGSKRR
jgi:hypothetical protein